jgi:EAL domain-containing protein (putative c-di-GMP-specific phosphodiesterase class I)
MSSALSQQPSMQEQALLNHLKRLERAGGSHLAVQVHLSKLITFQRLPECFDVVRTMLARESKKVDASLFGLFNNDLFVVCPRDALANVEAALARVSHVLGIDPFFVNGGEATPDFCSYFDFDSQFAVLIERVESLIQARSERDRLARTSGKAAGDGKPLDLSNLATLEKSIAQADLSAMTSRQAICEVGDDGRPAPLFYELFTSIGALRETLMPDQNFFSDRWLFQYLTTKLDQRMLAWLTKNDDATLKHSFSLNINISSVLSQRFLDFDALLDKTRRNTIVIELQKMDVFADIARYLFAREFLLDRGYRVCLDGLTALSLPFVERQKLGFDLIKLHWTPQLRQQIEGKDGERLRAAIADSNPRRIIMMRCESDDALELGHEHGISLFQGHFLDHLLAEKITREEAAERLSAALARHRRTAITQQSAVSS